MSNKAAVAAGRSSYVSRLRRAFLLRAHPDRFRSHPREVRNGQAKLLQAIADRMAAPDFLAYTCPSSPDYQIKPNSDKLVGECSFYLERKDGSLLSQTIRLDDTVVNVLKSMSDSLRSSGAPVISPPPSAPLASTETTSWKQEAEESNRKRTGRTAAEFGMLWAASTRVDGVGPREMQINHQFDVNTNRGRDLKSFLETMNTDEIEEKKASRMDAIAAALVARRAFQFQAIDGTGMGWSSSSLAMCLSMLTDLREEYKSKLRVDSFYPLRLILTGDEYRDKIDLYGGVVRLNPAATKLQWLATLMSVTDASLRSFRANQDALQSHTRHVQNLLNVRWNKGHSCSSREYHFMMKRLADALLAHDDTKFDSTTTALALDRIQVIVESEQACRRGTVTRDGYVRIGSGMTGASIIAAISKFRNDARRRFLVELEKEERCKRAMDGTRGEFGILRIAKVPLSSSVTSDQVLDCLIRLLNTKDSYRQILTHYLAGRTVGITGSGQFCHLGDDGSIVIPWDWQ